MMSPVKNVLCILRGNMKVCSKFHCNLLRSCQDISLETTNLNLNLMVAQEGSVDHQIYYIVWRHFLSICLVDVEKFHWISEKFDLPVALHEKAGLHPLGNMNVCPKYFANPSKLFRYFSLDQN